MNKQLIVVLGCLIKDKRILLDKRFDPVLSAAHEKWELPGGKIEFEETPREAIKREFLEETGIEVRVGKLLQFIHTNYWEYTWGKQQTICFTFFCQMITQHKNPKDEHIMEMKWFTFEEAKQLTLLPGVKEIIESAEKELIS